MSKGHIRFDHAKHLVSRADRILKDSPVSLLPNVPAAIDRHREVVGRELARSVSPPRGRGAAGVDRQDECQLVKPIRSQVPDLACEGAMEQQMCRGFRLLIAEVARAIVRPAPLQKVVVGEDAFPKP